MKSNKVLMLILCIVVCFVSCFSIGGNVLAATQKSDGKNMKKVLYYYGKKNYKKAKKYNKKISKTAHEACVSKMTKNMKKAYLKIVKRYRTDNLADTDYLSNKKYLWGYYLSDIDNDKKADLLLKIGTCEADVRLHVYRYRKGKAEKVGSVEAFHTYYYAYPNHSGILGYGGMMGEEWINKIVIKNGKLKSVKIGSRGVKEKWFGLRCQLKDHAYYDSYDKRLMDYKDLQ